MARFKRKINWKRILSATLAVVILVGCAAGITALVKKDTKTISSMGFERGSLNENGEYVETNDAIFTEDMFECMGLVIEADVKFTDSFKVFFYNYDGVFLSSTQEYTKTTRLDVPELAKYARVVINSDEEIKWYQVSKLASLLDIKVSKDQSFSLYNYFKLDEANPDKVIAYNESKKTVDYSAYIIWREEGSSENRLATGYSPVMPINVSGWNNVILKFTTPEDSTDVVYFFTRTNADGNEEIVPANSGHRRINGGMTEIIIEVPDGATIFHTNTFTDADRHYTINQYN